MSDASDCRRCVSWRESLGFDCPSHAPPCPGCSTTDCEPWTSRRLNCVETTPESRALETLANLLRCASSWEDRARILGNNRAMDIVHALTWALSKLAGGAPAPAEQLYYFLSRRPFREGEETCTWWGPDQCGLHGDLASAGKYPASALQTDTDQVCAIECEIVDTLAVSMVDRKHFNRLVAARFIPPT